MKRFLIFLIGIICVLITETLLYAELIDYGEDSALFYDNQSSLYWYDPGTFAGWSIDEIDTFVKEHPQWNWADLDRILELSSSMDSCNIELLTDIIGPGTYSLGSSCNWIGFIDPENTYVAAGLGIDSGETLMQVYTTIEDDTGNGDTTPVPVISGTILHGAWLYSENDPMDYTAPVPEPSTIFLIGTGLIGIAGVMRKVGRK